VAQIILIPSARNTSARNMAWMKQRTKEETTADTGMKRPAIFGADARTIRGIVADSSDVQLILQI
jgi:hypothetical protein